MEVLEKLLIEKDGGHNAGVIIYGGNTYSLINKQKCLLKTADPLSPGFFPIVRKGETPTFFFK